jgi:hypothetical protein
MNFRTPNFGYYLPVFFNDKYTEAFSSWNEDSKAESGDNPWGIIYKIGR